jgi:hypothetical protein
MGISVYRVDDGMVTHRAIVTQIFRNCLHSSLTPALVNHLFINNILRLKRKAAAILDFSPTVRNDRGIEVEYECVKSFNFI